jgi:putative SOS response-associated peptidase YedK
MAGLFDVWHQGPDQDPMYTFTILTTDSAKPLEWLHDRMPVIFRDQGTLLAMLGPFGSLSGD